MGKNKAAVLAQRYSRAYGVNVVPITKRITQLTNYNQLFSDLSNAPEAPGENSLVIMCVDSAQARRDIISAWSPERAGRRSRVYPELYNTAIFIDSGNEADFGQVNIFSRVIGHVMIASELNRQKSMLPSLRPATVDINVIPVDISHYANLEDHEGGSCADLDQTLAINALMATLIMGMVQNLYYVRPFTYHGIGISLSGGVSVQHLTPEYMMRTGQHGGANYLAGHLMACPTLDVSLTIRDYLSETLLALARMGLDEKGQPFKKDAEEERVEAPEAKSVEKVEAESAITDAAVEEAVAEEAVAEDAVAEAEPEPQAVATPLMPTLRPGLV